MIKGYPTSIIVSLLYLLSFKLLRAKERERWNKGGMQRDRKRERDGEIA